MKPVGGSASLGAVVLAGLLFTAVGWSCQDAPAVQGDQICTASLDLSGNSASTRAFYPEIRDNVPTAVPLLVEALDAEGAPTTYTIEPDRDGAIDVFVTDQGIAMVTPGSPGLVRAEVFIQGSSGAGATRHPDGYLTLSVPQLVVIEKDDFFEEHFLAQYHVDGMGDVYAEAKAALAEYMRDANARIVWRAGHDETIPPQYLPGGFAEGQFVRGTLHGNVLPDPCKGDLALAEDPKTQLDQSPIHICPHRLPTAFEELDQIVPLRVELGSLYPKILGRLIAREIAHETYHQILGCESYGGALEACHEPAYSPVQGLLIEAKNTTFTKATATEVKIESGQVTVANDLGLPDLVTLTPFLRLAADSLLPIPPAFAEYPRCGPGSQICDAQPQPMQIKCYPATTNWPASCVMDYCSSCCCLSVAICEDGSGCRETRGNQDPLDLGDCPDIDLAMHAYETNSTNTVILWPGLSCGILPQDGGCDSEGFINLCAVCD